MEETFLLWRASLKETQRKRTYKHFDRYLDLDNPKDFTEVSWNITHLKSHEFLPFIKFIKTDVRYRKSKGNTPTRSIKARPIMYVSHLDAHIYSFYAYNWSSAYEKFLINNNIDTTVIAYRKILEETNNENKGKSNIEFAKSVFASIREMGDCVVIVADITKFFDSLNHKLLKDQLCKVLERELLTQDEYKVLRSLTAYRYILKDDEKKSSGTKSQYSELISKINKKISEEKCSVSQAIYQCGRKIIKYNKSTIGIPQGSPLSGLLANIYMATFDSNLKRKFPNVIYRRYSDDIALVCPRAEVDKIFGELKNNLTSSQLQMNLSKVFLASFKPNEDASVSCEDVKNGCGESQNRKYIDYLGFEFDGQNVLLRGRTIKRSYGRAKTRIEKFYARQKESYSHKKPRIVVKERDKGVRGNYIERAEKGIGIIGSKIGSQKNSIANLLRKKRKSEREAMLNDRK